MRAGKRVKGALSRADERLGEATPAARALVLVAGFAATCALATALARLAAGPPSETGAARDDPAAEAGAPTGEPDPAGGPGGWSWKSPGDTDVLQPVAEEAAPASPARLTVVWEVAAPCDGDRMAGCLTRWAALNARRLGDPADGTFRVVHFEPVGLPDGEAWAYAVEGDLGPGERFVVCMAPGSDDPPAVNPLDGDSWQDFLSGLTKGLPLVADGGIID